MLKKLFNKKNANELSLYLGEKQISLCYQKEANAVSLVKKVVRSQEQWQEAFITLVHEQQLSEAKVNVVLEREFYQTFDIDKPKVEESEIMASLPFAIKDLVSESIFDLIVDYFDMPFQQRKSEQITAICLPKKRVLMIRDMLLATNFQLSCITTEELALTALLGNQEDTNVLLSQQNNELVLTVVKEGQLYFTHRLRGFNELIVLPLEEVEAVLIEGLSLELQRVLDYISSQLRINAINTLYLAVVCPDISLLAKKLGEYLGRNVQPFGENSQYDFLSLATYGGLKLEGK